MSHEYSENIPVQEDMKHLLYSFCHLSLKVIKQFRSTKLIAFSVVVFCLLLTMSGCSNKNTQDASADSIIEVEETEEVEDVKTIDVPVIVNIVHDSDPDLPLPAEYLVVNNTNDEIAIDTNSDYYNKYMSENRFNAPLVIGYFNEDVEYLTLELDIVNNTSESISVNELNINVEKSSIDNYPYIYISTAEDYSNCIQFFNGSWFNWKGFTFSYTILKKGQNFNGKYIKSVHIPYFDDVKTVNLLQDLKELGYDFDSLLSYVRVQNKQNGYSEDDPWTKEDDGSQYLNFGATDADDIASIQRWFYPFEFKRLDEYTYEGRATLYGSIKFDNTDIVKNFTAEISLSTAGGFGAVSYENDKFDVKLRTEGENYVKRFPYTTVIEPQGAEMIKLRVMADKSSNHNFFINVINDNELVIRSKNIKFHNFRPNKYENY